MRKKVDFWLENANIWVDMKKELWYKNKWLENANAENEEEGNGKQELT